MMVYNGPDRHMNGIRLKERGEQILEKQMERERNLNKIRGCLLGGAAGDALGYPVEFLSDREIRSRYGEEGIRDYETDWETGLALISDDTQMTLFTANGLLWGETQACTGGVSRDPVSCIGLAYQDWYFTQTGKMLRKKSISWLLDVPELHRRRAPGTTCLSALRSGKMGSVEEPLNHSKGCGGIMRVAPLGLGGWLSDRKQIDLAAAEAAALTHGHPLGYIPAAVLAHIVNVGVYGGCQRGDTLRDAVEDAMETAQKLFGGVPLLESLIGRAVSLAENGRPDQENIRELGEGWTGEEALAIAVYASLRYSEDFSEGIIAAVNHSGDSDSTGAVTGNILGAWLGCDAIEEKWKKNLELKNIILELADDLGRGCVITDEGSCEDPAWESKYIRCRKPGAV